MPRVYIDAVNGAYHRADKNELFNALYNCKELIQKDISFNPFWANGTGYFNELVRDPLPQLKVGDMARCRINLGQDQRRLIVIKTRFGNVVVFERYNAVNGELTGPLVCNAPQLVRKMEMFKPASGSLSVEDVVAACGDGSSLDNVGMRIEAFFIDMKTFELRTETV